MTSTPALKPFHAVGAHSPTQHIAQFLMEQLRAVYSDLLSQPVPQHLIKIIERLPQPNPHPRSQTIGRSTDMRSVALVVDDDADERNLAAAILEETDLRVVEASSGEQALDYLRAQAGEVVFLFTATRLPCLMSGVDLARNVQSNWPWVRVIVTSGTSLGPDELSELPREVRVMPKPWNVLDVLIEAEKANAGQPALGFS